MTPTGAVFTSMRVDLLDTFPAGTKASPTQPQVLSGWFQNGAYTVPSTTKSEVVIEAAADDVSSVLLTELELFTDHCFEQLNEVGCSCLDDRQRSDAWNIVTMYYFGFFAVQVLLRLVGRPSLFLEKDTVRRFQALSGSADSPGGGAFYMERIGSVGVNRVQYRLRKSKEKIHESCWKALFTYIKSKTDVAHLPQKSPEALFFSSFGPAALHSHYHPFDWPPQIRAKANYLPGFAYVMVAHGTIARTRSFLNPWKDIDSIGLVRLLEASAKRCNASPRDSFEDHSHFLFDLCLAVFALTRQLYRELLDRRRIDRRWELRRRKFRKDMVFPDGEYANAVPVM